MPIEIRCQCGKKLKVPDKLAGRMVACPKCNAQIQVPAIAAPDDEYDYEENVADAPASQRSAFGSPPQFLPPRASRATEPDDQRYSLREFVDETAQQDHGQGFFELESPYMLEVNLNGMVWTKMGSMIAYVGNIKFVREGILEKGLGKMLKKDISLKTFFGRGSGESIQMHFRGSGFVVVQPYEEVYFQAK